VGLWNKRFPPFNCNSCGCLLEDSNWFPSSKKSRHYICKPCHQKQARTWANINDYGLESQAEFDALLKAQNGVCAICKQPETQVNRINLSVDHNHSTGKPRGLLCSVCNRGIGYLKDSVELVGAALDYLKKYQE
jgi:hypothetical protein